jgi:hypothetical protein
MIVVYPMLTDESISQNAIPGICKALEKFVLLYEIDAITKMAGRKVIKIGGEVAGALAKGSIAGKIKEDTNLLEARPPSGYIPPVKSKEEQEQFLRMHGSEGEGGVSATIKGAFEIIKGIRQMGTVNVDMPKDQFISVEPTYLLVTTSTGTETIGIKVIPFPVKSKNKYTLAELLAADKSLDFFDALFFRIYRKVIRLFWVACRGLRIPFLKRRVLSGDPVKDVLWASTFHKRYVFCLLNYADISDSDLLRNAGGMKKLHDVGWNSLIFADDVNKRAIFCMKEFHGLCSSVPYQFIYSSLGQSKVYDNLEDVKKSASPFFKLSVSAKRVYGESKNIINNYLKRIS